MLWVKSVYEPSGVSGKAGAYPSFRNMKRPTAVLPASGGMLVYRRVTASITNAGPAPIYTPGQREAMCLALEHSAMSWAGLEPELLDTRGECSSHEASAPPQNGSTHQNNKDAAH